MPSLFEETKGSITHLTPGACIGIVGGGQLGRMMALSARYRGFKIGVLDPTPDCPAAQVADFQIRADYKDREAIRKLSQACDVLTYEFENVDADALDQVRDLVAIPQGTELLRVTQDRVQEKTFINQHGVATAPWLPVDGIDSLEEAAAQLGYPAVLKTRTGGYDGHGQVVLDSEQDLNQFLTTIGNRDAAGVLPPSVLEGFVNFAFEASILVSGNGNQYVTFPLVRNEHHHNILHMTLAPSGVDPEVEDRARELALKLAHGFALAGTLAIELFVMPDQSLVVNELAPRPHNSGHYTIEACSMDQFDAHIRGIAGWPLPEPQLLSPALMVNILGQHLEGVRSQLPYHPEWSLHDYGKAQVRPNRKMGHLTVLTENPQLAARDLEATGIWRDLP